MRNFLQFARFLVATCLSKVAKLLKKLKRQHSLENDLPAEKVPDQNGKSSEQTLLAEYDACEQYVDSAATRDWQVAGIIWGAALAGLFFVLSLEAELSRATLVIVTSVYPFLIASIWLFWRMVKRMVFFQNICRGRMRQIEAKLGMRKEIHLYLLDNWAGRNEMDLWKQLPEDVRDYLQKTVEMRKEAPRPTTGLITLVINWIITCAWSVMIILEWLAYFKLLN
jgi:hypothetical protein